nr:hypothetical protein CFP56_50688 [Quercus suber]
MDIDIRACVFKASEFFAISNSGPNHRPSHSTMVYWKKPNAGFYYSQICHYKIVHTFKEGNRCDDAMARRGVTMDSDFVLLSSVPKDMRNLVAFDASEEALPRSIPWPL